MKTQSQMDAIVEQTMPGLLDLKSVAPELRAAIKAAVYAEARLMYSTGYQDGWNDSAKVVCTSK